MNTFATINEQNTVMLVRDLPGPIERVWAFLTEPKFLSRWFSDGVVANHVGGEVRFEMGADGRITVYEPPKVLEYTWNERERSRGPVIDTLVRWELAQSDQRVRLILTHTRLSERDTMTHSAGWHAFLDCLDATLDGREPPQLMERFEELFSEYEKRHNITQ